MTPFQLCSNVASPTVGAAVSVGSKPEDTYKRTYQASLVGGGSATVKIQASADNRSWLDLATITLSTTTPSEGFSSEVPWLYVRANVTAVSTGKVDAVMTI
jgi:type 1 fimbria pilin